MTPGRLAQLHAMVFTVDRPWSEDEFAILLDNRFTELFPHPHGFALTRTLAGESELLTLAVDPAYHRQGIAQFLLNTWLESIQPHTEHALLEVAADNVAAIALYKQNGFTTTTTRKAYYIRKNADPVDALLMQLTLSQGQIPDSTGKPPKSG